MKTELTLSPRILLKRLTKSEILKWSIMSSQLFRRPRVLLERLTESKISNLPRKREGSHKICFTCGKSFSKTYIKTHLNKKRCKRGKPYACKYCSDTFTTKGERNTHVRIHFHKCNICKCTINMEYDLLKHEKIHFKNNVYFPLNTTLDEYVEDKTRPILFQCKFCGVKDCFEFISEHAKSLPCLHCDKCKRQFLDMAALKKHELVVDSLSIKCIICHKIRSSECALYRHTQKHLQPYFSLDKACNICGLYRTSQTGRMMHLKTHFESGRIPPSYNLDKEHVIHSRRINCEMCYKLFTSVYGLKQHWQRMHPENYPESRSPKKCFQCHKVFKTKTEFDGHVRSHLREQWYKCNICDKHCSTNADLTKHYVVHSGTKEHECKFCGKRFGIKDNLRRHVRCIHEKGEKKCGVCGKVFPENSYLKDHMVRHNKNKEFKCKFCEGKFQYRSNMYRHIRDYHRKK